MQKKPLGPVRAITFDMYGTLLDLVASFASGFDEFLRNRTSRSLEHVFTVLSLVLRAEPLKIAFRGLHSDNRTLRGTALEYLESVLPADIREKLWPFLEYDADAKPTQSSPRAQVLAALLQSRESVVGRVAEPRR